MSKVLVVGNKGFTADALESDHPVLVHSSLALIDPAGAGDIKYMEVVVDWSHESYLQEYKVEVDFESITELAGAFGVIHTHKAKGLPYDKVLMMGKKAPYVVLPEDYMRLVHEFMGNTKSDERIIVVTPTSEDYDWLEDMGFDALYDNVVPIDFEFFTHAVDNLLESDYADEHEVVKMLQRAMSTAEDTVYTTGHPQMKVVFDIAVFAIRLISRIDWTSLVEDLVDGIVYDDCCCSSPVHGWDKGAEREEGTKTPLSKNVWDVVLAEFEASPTMSKCETGVSAFDEYLIEGYRQMEEGNARAKREEYEELMKAEEEADRCDDCEELCIYNKSRAFRNSEEYYIATRPTWDE